MRCSLLVTIGIVMFSALLTSTCYAEKWFDDQGDEVAYAARYHKGLFDGYFTSGQGTTTVSIDDVSYGLIKGAIIRSSSKSILTLDQVEVGAVVNFFEVGNEITKLWISEDQSRKGENLSSRQAGEYKGSSSEGQVSETQDGELKLENGIWTN